MKGFRKCEDVKGLNTIWFYFYRGKEDNGRLQQKASTVLLSMASTGGIVKDEDKVKMQVKPQTHSASAFRNAAENTLRVERFKNPRMVNRRAKHLIQKGELDEAQSLLYDALDLYPKNPFFIHLLLTIYTKKGDEEGSKALYEKHKEGFDEFSYGTVIHYYLSKKELEKAKQLYSEMLERGFWCGSCGFDLTEELIQAGKIGDAFEMGTNIPEKVRDVRPAIPLSAFFFDDEEVLKTLFEKFSSELQISLAKGTLEHLKDPEKRKTYLQNLGFLDEQAKNKAYLLFLQKDDPISAEELASNFLPSEELIFFKRRLIHTYLRQELFSRAEALSEEIFDTLTPKELAKLLKHYADVKNYEKAHAIFDIMRKKGLADIKDYTVMVRLCAESLNVEEAEKLYAELPEEPDEIFLTALMYVYVRAHQPEKAEEIFKKIRWPGEYAHTILLQAYSESGQILKAVRFFEKMEKRGLLDSAAISIGLQIFGSLGLKEKVEALTEFVPKEDKALRTALWKAYMYIGEEGKAQEILDTIKDYDEYDTSFITTSIKVYLDLGRKEDAKKLAKELFSIETDETILFLVSNWLKDVDAINSLIAKGKREELKQPHPPSFWFYAANALLDVGQVREGIKLANTYLHKQPMLYAALLLNAAKAYSDKGCADEILKLREVLFRIQGQKQKNLLKQMNTLLLKAHLEGGQLAAAESFYERMKNEEGEEVESKVYGIMLSYFLRTKKIEKAEECLNVLKERSVPLTAYYEQYLNYLYVTGKYEEILHLEEPMNLLDKYFYCGIRAEALRKLKQYDAMLCYIEKLKKELSPPRIESYRMAYDDLILTLDVVEAYTYLHMKGEQAKAISLFRQLYKKLSSDNPHYVRVLVGLVFSGGYLPNEKSKIRRLLKRALKDPLRSPQSKKDVQNALDLLG